MTYTRIIHLDRLTGQSIHANRIATAITTQGDDPLEVVSRCCRQATAPGAALFYDQRAGIKREAEISRTNYLL